MVIRRSPGDREERGSGKGWKGGNKKHLSFNFTEGSSHSLGYLPKQNRIRQASFFFKPKPKTFGEKSQNMIYSPRICDMSTSTVNLDWHSHPDSSCFKDTLSRALRAETGVPSSPCAGRVTPSSLPWLWKVPSVGPFHRATMPHSKEYASCSCLKKDCIIFQNPTHLSYWPYEEGRARAFSQRECLMKRNQQPDIRALWAEKDWSPIFQARLCYLCVFH